MSDRRKIKIELPKESPTFLLNKDDKNLGTFSPESPKLPPRTTFEAMLSPDKGGRSVMLKVDRESIRLPETLLPSIDSPEVSQTSDLAKPAGNAIRPNGIAQNISTYQPPKFQQEPASKPETAVNNGKCDTTNAKADNWRLSLQNTLFSVVSETYKQRRCPQTATRSQFPNHSTQHFKFGDNQWTAYVQPNGDCFVRNESKRTLFKANVHTGDVQIPLTEQAVARFQEMIVEREKALSQYHTSGRLVTPNLTLPLILTR